MYFVNSKISPSGSPTHPNRNSTFQSIKVFALFNDLWSTLYSLDNIYFIFPHWMGTWPFIWTYLNSHKSSIITFRNNDSCIFFFDQIWFIYYTLNFIPFVFVTDQLAMSSIRVLISVFLWDWRIHWCRIFRINSV